MASLIYNSLFADLPQAVLDLDSANYKMMLVGAGYTASKSHSRRSDITSEITGTGYTAGGNAVTIAISVNNTLNRILYTVSAVNWPTATFSARGGVIYRARGGASSADELLFYNDFGSVISKTADTFPVAQSIATVQN